MNKLTDERYGQLLNTERKYKKLLKEYQLTLVKCVEHQENARFFEWQRDEVWKMYTAKPRKMVEYILPRD